MPEVDAGHVYHPFPVRTPERDAFQAHLRAMGVETLIHYPVASPQQPAFSAFSPADCPYAARAAAEVLSLPLYPRLDESDITRAADAARAFQKGRVLA